MELNKERLKEQNRRNKALDKKEAEEKTRLKEILELRSTGLYKEPPVEWGKAKEAKE